MNKRAKQEQAMIDLIRSIMYAGEDGESDAGNDGSLMIQEVRSLATILAKYDGGVFIPEVENRILIALNYLSTNSLDIFRRIERINGDRKFPWIKPACSDACFRTWITWVKSEFKISGRKAGSLLRRFWLKAQADGFPLWNGVECTDLQKMRSLLTEELNKG